MRGKSSFPTVVAQDVRVEGGGHGASTRHMWKHMSLVEINTALMTPLTRDEVLFNLQSSPDLSVLPKYRVAFVPAALGSGMQVIYVQLCNPGYLTTSFSIHLPNERDIELEPWADEGEPTEADVKINRIIDELKCFDVQPRSGTLPAGETATIRLAYSYSSRDFEGQHTLPVLLRVAQGKQFWLELHGRTLAPVEPFLLPCCDANSRSEALHPVAVGTEPSHTPLQTTELLNTGLAALEYEVEIDTSADPAAPGSTNQEADDEDSLFWGFKWLHLENPTGEIEPQGSVLLRWRFMPVQPREYTATLRIRYSGGAVGAPVTRVEVLTITARGYDPRAEDRTPCRRRSSMPAPRRRPIVAQVVAGRARATGCASAHADARRRTR